MARDMLRVDGVLPETKAQLKAESLRLFGQENASLLVRFLIAEHLKKSAEKTGGFSLDLTDEKVRVELRLPRSVLSEIIRRADEQFSTKNYFLTNIIYSYLGQAQLHGDEIETLRRSNYELAKIGSNLNQIAKAFNVLVKMGGGEKTPEIGKKMVSLRKAITEHTNKVLRVLNAKTVVWENKGRGQKPQKKR